MKKCKIIGDIRQLWRTSGELLPNPMTDTDAELRVKMVLNDSSKVKPTDRTLFILYTEAGSLRKLAELIAPEFKISKSTLRNEIARIRQQILANL